MKMKVLFSMAALAAVTFITNGKNVHWNGTTGKVTLFDAATIAGNTADFSQWLIPEDRDVYIKGGELICGLKKKGTSILVK